MNKRGTHVGVILSFLIFVTFLAFLYSVTEPVTRVSRDKLDLLDYLKIELVKEFSEDMSTLTINLSEEGCVIFSEFDEGLRGLGVVAKDSEDNQLNAHRIGGDTEVNETEIGILKLYYSKEFSNGTDLDCENILGSGDYEIRIFRTTQEIFASRITRVSNEIEGNITYYNKLKEKLGASLDDEFGFTFTDKDKTFIAGTEEKDVDVDIYSEEIPIQYLDSKANINPGFLSIRVW